MPAFKVAAQHGVVVLGQGLDQRRTATRACGPLYLAPIGERFGPAIADVFVRGALVLHEVLEDGRAALPQDLGVELAALYSVVEDAPGARLVQP